MGWPTRMPFTEDGTSASPSAQSKSTSSGRSASSACARSGRRTNVPVASPGTIASQGGSRNTSRAAARPRSTNRESWKTMWPRTSASLNTLIAWSATPKARPSSSAQQKQFVDAVGVRRRRPSATTQRRQNPQQVERVIGRKSVRPRQDFGVQGGAFLGLDLTQAKVLQSGCECMQKGEPITRTGKVAQPVRRTHSGA